MDKKVILAVAGSGKTTYLVEQLDEIKRFLIITYTISNTENLRVAIIKKFGYFPPNIKVKPYFTFLHSFCFKPLLANEIKSKGIYWKFPSDNTRNLSRSNDSYYLLNGKWLYHNRIAKLLQEKGVIPEIIKRLEKYYDCILIDEIQDFAGHDFNLLSDITKCHLQILFVGDFFQHTFNTSSDGATNINLHKDSLKYSKRFIDMGLAVDPSTLNSSHRCSKTICDFIRTQLGIEIFSKSQNITMIELIEDKNKADQIYHDNAIVKLFLKQHYEYKCRSDNWANCKGLEFENVCVVVNDDTLKLYKGNDLKNLNTQTKNKFYVACTRTKQNLYIVPQKLYKEYKKLRPT